jgi:integrase
VVKVRLKGLKIARSRGKYYVYRRDSGVALIRGFEGTKDQLRKRLAMPDMLGAYNAGRKRPKNASYPDHSLGWLVAWFTDPDKSPAFAKLAESTKAEYKSRLSYLEPEYDAPLETITQPALYAVRDRCVAEKWPDFADKMMTAASSMFKQAVQRGWMTTNPAVGVERVSQPDKNANREWRPEEWLAIAQRAPRALLTAYMIARYLGYRGQSIVTVRWDQYQPDSRFGMCFRMTHRKNSESHWLPARPILQDYLSALPRSSEFIAIKRNGQPWESPKQLQNRSANFLAKMIAEKVVDPGLTLHGLRVTFAAEIKRLTQANDDQVAAALGDRDTRMGRHYTRHVEQENKLISLFFEEAERNKIWKTEKKMFSKIAKSVVDVDT